MKYSASLWTAAGLVAGLASAAHAQTARSSEPPQTTSEFVPICTDGADGKPCERSQGTVLIEVKGEVVEIRYKGEDQAWVVKSDAQLAERRQADRMEIRDLVKKGVLITASADAVEKELARLSAAAAQARRGHVQREASVLLEELTKLDSRTGTLIAGLKKMKGDVRELNDALTESHVAVLPSFRERLMHFAHDKDGKPGER